MVKAHMSLRMKQRSADGKRLFAQSGSCSMGQWLCCDSTVVGLSETPQGMQHMSTSIGTHNTYWQSSIGTCCCWYAPVASLRTPMRLCVLQSSGWGNSWRKRELGLSSWEKELGATEDRGTKLHPHLQSHADFYFPVTPQHVPVSIRICPFAQP